MRRFLLAAALAAVAVSLRPKHKDETGRELIELDQVSTGGCADSYYGYAIVDGSLEKCDNYTALQMGGMAGGAKAYEEYKCKHLRLHGEMKSGKCVCKDPWRGAACHHYTGCPDATPSLHNGACSKTGCGHGGEMAIGTKHMECICKDQWDGRLCDRLACWRLTEKGNDKRRKNGKDGKCECGTHYEGENCATLKSCDKFGKFENGVCVCNEGYGGETCDRKCPAGQVTCSTGSIFSALLALPLLATVFHRLF